MVNTVSAQVSRLQEQEKRNSTAWWTVQHAFDSGQISKSQLDSQQKALHQQNINLANAINQISKGTIQQTYDGGTGKWRQVQAKGITIPISYPTGDNLMAGKGLNVETAGYTTDQTVKPSITALSGNTVNIAVGFGILLLVTSIFHRGH